MRKLNSMLEGDKLGISSTNKEIGKSIISLSLSRWHLNEDLNHGGIVYNYLEPVLQGEANQWCTVGTEYKYMRKSMKARGKTSGSRRSSQRRKINFTPLAIDEQRNNMYWLMI